MRKRLLKITGSAAVLMLMAGVWWLWSRPRVVFLGFPGSYMALLREASGNSKVAFDYWGRKRMEDPKLPAGALDRYRVIFVSGRRTDPLPASLKQAILRAQERSARVIVIPPERAADLGVGNADFSGPEKDVAAYFEFGGADNMTRALEFVARRYLGRPGQPPPPVPTPDYGYYHPESAAKFPSTQAYLEWYKSSGRWKEGGFRVMIDFADGWKIGSTAGTDALVRAFEKKGWNVAAVFGRQHAGRLALEWRPDILLTRSHGRWFEGQRGVDLLARELDVPLMRGMQLFFSAETLAEYRSSRAGLRGAALAVGAIVPELDGAIEPTLLEGLDAEWYGARREAVLEDRVERLTERASRWVQLKKKPNAQKRIAVVYFAGIGKGRITASGLNVPASLVRLLSAMRDAGYRVSPVPSSPDKLAADLVAYGRNVAESQRGELEKLAAAPGVELLPAAEYELWFRELPPALQKQVTDAFGPPPGNLMTLEKNHGRYLVIPKLDFGNVILLPQPPRSANYTSRQAHDDKIPPPHHFLAVYWWLERKFGADAIIHYGTHGTHEFLPGRPAGQLSDDWSDITLGRLLNVYVYTMDNVGEALIAKRRGSAVIVSHQTPPIVYSGIEKQDPELAGLKRLVAQFEALEEGAVKEAARKRIRDMAVRRGLDRDIQQEWSSRVPSGQDVAELGNHLHLLEEDRIPLGLHTHGVANTDSELAPVIVAALGKDFLRRAGGEQQAQLLVSRWMRAAPAPQPSGLQGARMVLASAGGGSEHGVVSAGTNGDAAAPDADAAAAQLIARMRRDFAETEKEIDRTLHALDGGYVRPGPGGDPVRNPSALPTGRNLFGVNPRETPTRPAWDVGVQLAKDLVEKERKRLGRYPRKIGFTLWNTELIRHYGTDLAQILYLLGLRPKWNEQGLVEGVEAIPAAELGRPRIDVVIQAASLYRDTFPDRMEFLDQAVRFAASLRDAQNYVAENSARTEQELKNAGLSAADARRFALARIFSNAPGGYGTGVIEGIERSGSYQDAHAISEGYLRRTGAVYTAGAEWGQMVPGLYRAHLAGTDAVALSRSSNMYGALTLDHYFEYLGGMTMAVRETTGEDPETYVSDVRDPARSAMLTAQQALRAELRTKFWNPAWISAQQKENFSGAVEIAKIASNLFGWQVSKPNAVSPDVWDTVEQIYVQDALKLNLRNWFNQHNPFAWQSLTATMLETARKGYWKPPAEVLQRLAQAYAESVARHGHAGDMRTTDNAAFQAFVEKQLISAGTPETTRLARDWKAAVERSSGGRAALQVAGQKLVREILSPQSQSAVRISALALLILGAIAAFIRFGLARRRNP